MTTPADFLRDEPPKPKAETVPTLHFHVPKLTGQQIVESVQKDKALWKLLSQTALESEGEKRAKALERKWGMTPIPEPDGFWDAEDL